MLKWNLLTAHLAILLLTALLPAHAQIQVQAHGFLLKDIKDGEHQFPESLAELEPAEALNSTHKPVTGKYKVLMFIGLDCPIANFFLPEWERINKDYAQKGFDFICVHELADVTKTAALKHQTDYQITAPVILDPERKLMKLTGVKVLSEVAVLDEAGHLLYRGRLNDQYIGPGKKRLAPTVHDLRNALSDIERQGFATQSRTTAVGCYLERK
jgi:hypothetical protein